MLVVLVSLSFGASTALAQTTLSPTPCPLLGSAFQGGDGDQANQARPATCPASDFPPELIDWQGFQADGRVGHISDPNANDTIFGGPGSGPQQELNPGNWMITTTSGGASPGSGNVLDTYRAADRHDGGNAFLYMAFTREASNGTIFVTFELNQEARPWRFSSGYPIPCRTTGDLLIVFGPHGNTSQVSVDKWDTTEADPTARYAGGPVGCAMRGTLHSATLGPSNVQAAFNYTAPSGPGDITNYLPVGQFYSPPGPIPELRFGEAAVNLSAVLDDLTGNPCHVFGSIWMHSRASLSDTADLKDYVRPEPFSLDTCKATPTLRTEASGAISRTARRHRLRRHAVLTRSLTVHDVAILEGGDNPTGTLTFKLFGPNDASCTTLAFQDSMSVDGNGAYDLPSLPPVGAGTYRWVVEYSGDDHNTGAGPTPCGADTETIAIAKASPTLTTSASCVAPARTLCPAGDQIRDHAFLDGGFNPTGTITFHLYGPRDRRCRTPIDTSTATVDGSGEYFSTTFTPTRAGTYRWRATYNGDANNNGDGPTPCGDPTETIRIERAHPELTTVASGATVFDNPISDQATLTGGARPTGTIIFRVYGPNNDTCSGRPAHVVRVPVDRGNDTYSSGPFTPPAVGTYRWVARYTGDGFNAPAGPTSCEDPAEAQDVAHEVVQPSLTSRVVASSALAPAGSAIRDFATLSGGSAPPAPAPSGTIVFKVYGPNDTGCSGPAAATSKVTVTGNGTYTSGTFRPTEAGVYRWVAIYLGDDLNKPAKTVCGDPAETITVTMARPSISTAATASVTLPGFMRDAATLSGGVNPTGTILFEAFGPNNPGCSDSAAFSAELNVAGNGVYRSPRFFPRAAGTYYWRVTYSGDDNNNLVVTACGGPGETTVVLPHTPSLTTSASPRARLHPSARRARSAGLEIYDSATLTGFRPTGEIVFKLYGPNNDTCSGRPIFITATAVNGNGIYDSEGFTPEVSGTYRWTATYSGDGNNNPVGPTACADPNEAVQVTVPAHTSLITSASDAVALGGAIRDTAILSGGSDPTGTITFKLYAPSDAPNDVACSGRPIFTSTVDVRGNGDYTSASFVPGAAGAYLWVASYSGDHANHPASTACRDAGETGVVRPPDITPVTPAFSTTASPPADGKLSDTAHLSGGIDPGGAITFMLFGPDDASCSGPPVFTAVTAVDGNGDFDSAPFPVTLPGTYRWVASYAGDAMNNPVATACGDPAETVTVSSSLEPDLPDGPNVPPPPPPPRPPKPKPKPPHHPKPPFTG